LQTELLLKIPNVTHEQLVEVKLCEAKLLYLEVGVKMCFGII